jgi:hypothetical protein
MMLADLLITAGAFVSILDTLPDALKPDWGSFLYTNCLDVAQSDKLREVSRFRLNSGTSLSCGKATPEFVIDRLPGSLGPAARQT